MNALIKGEHKRVRFLYTGTLRAPCYDDISDQNECSVD